MDNHDVEYRLARTSSWSAGQDGPESNYPPLPELHGNGKDWQRLEREAATSFAITMTKVLQAKMAAAGVIDYESSTQYALERFGNFTTSQLRRVADEPYTASLIEEWAGHRKGTLLTELDTIAFALFQQMMKEMNRDLRAALERPGFWRSLGDYFKGKP